MMESMSSFVSTPYLAPFPPRLSGDRIHLVRTSPSDPQCFLHMQKILGRILGVDRGGRHSRDGLSRL
jgi:hypothetical protein